MLGPLEELASTISPAVAMKIASSLSIDANVMKAAQKLPEPQRPLLARAFSAIGAEGVTDALRAISMAASRNAVDLRAVWSGPSFTGDGDHTTAALSHLVDEATEDVFASTYSASPTSLYMQALWRSVARGVKTTVLLDTSINGGKTAAWMRQKLIGARFLEFVPGADGGIQHSKVVIVDSAVAFVTSANLSEAAHERNLETGVVVRDSKFASTLRQRFASLQSAGHLRTLGE